MEKYIEAGYTQTAETEILDKKSCFHKLVKARKLAERFSQVCESCGSKAARDFYVFHKAVRKT